MTETPPDPTTQAEVSEEPAPEPQTEPDTPPAEPTPDEEPQDPPATEPGAEPQTQPPSPVGGNPDIPQPEQDKVIYTPGEEPEDPGEVVIATLTPEQGVAGTNDQQSLIYGENLDLLRNWRIEAGGEELPVTVDVVDSTRANVTVPLSTFPTQTDETINIVGETEDGEEVAAEFIVTPFLTEDGGPITDSVFGQEVEIKPNPLRLPQTPPVTN